MFKTMLNRDQRMDMLKQKREMYILLVLLLTGSVAYQGCSNKSGSTGQTVEQRIEKLSKAESDAIKSARQVLKVIPDTLSSENNELNTAKARLGKMLYYDTRLSRSNTISCNSCHNLATYGVDNNKTSMGHGWQLGPRNAPTVLNAANQIAQFWDGRSPSVEDQATGPVGNPIEMGGAMPDKSDNQEGHLIAVERVASIEEYQQLFAEAFNQQNNNVTLNNIGKAIGAFERLLSTPAPIDRYLQGRPEALNDQQKQGLKTFMEVGCTTCHSGTHIGGKLYQKFGLVNGPYWKYTGSEQKDPGRYSVTNNESDEYVFKVPTLRNIVHTYPYFHDGSVWQLEEAIRIMATTQLGVELSDKQADDLMAFMESLTGKVDKSYRTLPLLPTSDEDTPRPNYEVAGSSSVAH